MTERDKQYDYCNNDKKLEEDGDAIVVLDECVNKIIVKPVVNITTNIEGLETSMFTTKSNGGNQDEKPECEDENVELIVDSINCIVVKPVVEMDIDINGLNTNITM